MHTAGDLRGFERGALLNHFGRYGYRLYDLARGIDERAVEPDQPVQSISSEDTFERDLPLEEAYAYTARVMTENLLKRDAEEGIAAFIAKRPPQWTDEP